MATFRRARGSGVRVRFEEHEAALLKELAKEMRLLVEADVPRADPVVARLFPQAYAEPDDERAFRDLVGDELRDGKLRALDVVTETLERDPVDVTLAGDELDAWLAWLTDVRLAIGTRLDMTEEKMGAEIDPHDADAPALSVLHWLGWVQGSMLEAIGVSET